MAAHIWVTTTFLALLGLDKDFRPDNLKPNVATAAPKKQAGKVLSFEPIRPAWTGRPRLALIIGNGDYVNTGDLPKVHGDTWLMVDALREAGFRVLVVEDADLRSMQLALGQFSEVGAAMTDLEAALVYYSGHGARIPEGEDMKTLLLPTDSDGAKPYTLGATSVPVDRVQAALLGTGADIFMSILDSCRVNPFHPVWVENNLIAGTKSTDTKAGLGQPKPPPGVSFLIAHAAQAGHVAWDGVYTPRLAENIRSCGGFAEVFNRTDLQVQELTNSEQAPLLNVSMRGKDFHFHGGPACGAEPSTPPAPYVVSAPLLTTGSDRCPTPRPSSEGKQGLHWVCVPPGTTKFGYDGGGYGDKNEEFEHWVRFSKGFWMLDAPMSERQVALLGIPRASLNPYARPKEVANLTWDDARDACLAAGGELPSEYQWEYAARGGGAGEFGLGQDNEAISDKNIHEYVPLSPGYREAKMYRPNAYGLYDFWIEPEWTRDVHSEAPFVQVAARANEVLLGTPLVVDPGYVERVSPVEGHYRVLRVANSVKRLFGPEYPLDRAAFRCVSEDPVKGEQL